MRIGFWTFRMAALALLPWMAGCAMPKSYTILHVPEGVNIPVRCESSGAELLLGVSDDTRTFRILGGHGAVGKGFTIRRVSYDDGRVVERAHIPFFSNYYERYYVYGLGFAVSPSACRIAYLDMESKALMAFDTRSRVHSVLWTNFAEHWVNIGILQWVSDKELLAGASAPGDTNTVLLLLNAEAHSVVMKLQPRKLLKSHNALSPSGRYFAYWEQGESPRLLGSFNILDLKTRQIVAGVKADRLLGSEPLWSRDNEELIYVEGNVLNEPQTLMCFHLPSGTCKVLKAHPNRLISSPLYYTGRRLFCRIHNMDGFPRRPPAIYVLDLSSGEESVISDPEIWGETFVADAGRVIIYGMGQ